MLPRPPTSTLFPYTTLFRSANLRQDIGGLLTAHDANASVGPHPEKTRSEEHTSELQSRGHLVCRLLLEKKKKTTIEDANSLQTDSYQPGTVRNAMARLERWT